MQDKILYILFLIVIGLLKFVLFRKKQNINMESFRKQNDSLKTLISERDSSIKSQLKSISVAEKEKPIIIKEFGSDTVYIQNFQDPDSVRNYIRLQLQRLAATRFE